MDGWVDGWVDGWMDGWVGVKAGLRIAYSNQKGKRMEGLKQYINPVTCAIVSEKN